MANASEPSWTVTGQAEQMNLDDQGAFVPGVTVSFRTADGHNGTVWLPNTRYTLDAVRAAIAERAAAFQAVAKLQG